MDIVLTERGRELYALGQLDFEYFGLFDDGLDYDPWSTGSLSDEEREAQIEATPMLEAPFIRDVRGTVAPLEPTSHLFTAAGGYRSIPRMSSPTDRDGIDLMADQRRQGETYTRTGTSLAQIDMKVVGDTEAGNPGFIVRVLISGSNGLQALEVRNDLQGRRSFDPFLAVSIDGEGPIDRPSVDDPSSSRVVNRISPRKR
ncbi:MAG TPA: hypothetical protein VFT74_19060 [Isosphaeraceae bacterium]|nr:hypothetical protein [Isosphaeraceae bacterium]